VIHAYDETYLVHSTRVLGWMLDSAVNLFEQKAASFWRLFISTGYAERFGLGESGLLAGRTGYELARDVLDAAQVKYRPTPPAEVTDLSPEYWAGWALAHYQWRTALSFAEIDGFAPIDDVIACYSPYHEMDVDRFCEHLDGLYAVAHPESRLKAMREKRGMTQEELSAAANVPVRMIQHYEQRVKDIGKAAFETVFRLAQALRTPAERLIEPRRPLRGRHYFASATGRRSFARRSKASSRVGPSMPLHEM
jgi:transcriptional regulator with XRE-family HTH domain